MKDLLETDKIEFEKNGYIIKNILANNDNFKNISAKFKNELAEILKKKDHYHLGGYKSGNLNISPGEYGVEILSILNRLNFEKYFNFLTSENIKDYQIIYGGNLNLINSKNQFFHTDGNWNPRMIVLNIATTEINLSNGPLEVIEKSHNKNLSYLNFLLKSLFLKKKKIELKFGDILIREHRLWHRGTKNKSKNHREMLGIAFLKSSEINNYSNQNKSLYLHSNIFGTSKREKFKEFIFLRLRFILFIYKVIVSLRKK